MIPRFEPTVDVSETLAFIGHVLRDGDRTGEVVPRFEQQFAAYLGGGVEAVFVPSGRMALWLMLTALDYPSGSEVIIPAFTYFAIPAMVQYLGLVPVYADIDASTYELSASSVAAALSGKTRAVIPTHLFGRTCDLTALKYDCDSRGIDVIEDCAQACGAAIGGERAGTLGRAAYFTFGVTKNFTTFSGGMLVTRDSAVAREARERLSRFPGRGRTRLLKEGITALAMRVGTQRLVFNSSLSLLLKGSRADAPDFVHVKFEERLHAIHDDVMDSLRWRPADAQARAGLRQLQTIEEKNDRRRHHGAQLLDALRDAGCGGLPEPVARGGDHIFMSFAIRRSERYRFAAGLRARGVDVSPGYMTNCAAEPALGGVKGTCPVAAEVESSILHLPLYPGLRKSDIQRIARAVAETDNDMA